jgi:O-antigen biosynthesis protein WbqP
MPLGLIVAAAVKATSPGAVLFRTERVGRNNKLFTMFKFRTMRTDTPQLATHLLENPRQFLTPVGGFLRRTSLDEMPQLINILRGDMSLVGPRPALFNQHDLVALRTEKGVHLIPPGLTGWAQINGRDSLPLEAKVAFDEEYLRLQSPMFDLRIIVFTLIRMSQGSNISH